MNNVKRGYKNKTHNGQLSPDLNALASSTANVGVTLGEGLSPMALLFLFVRSREGVEGRVKL